MTTPDVPLRLELEFELPGTAEQIWDAIATGNGMAGWFSPAEVEEREGGALRLFMGEGITSTGSVTKWDPPHVFGYEEPEWPDLMGHPGADVTPMVSEFIIEARSGGSCVLRVVTSAFGTGADWEQEVFDDMTKHWVPFFDNLRLYLTHFAGQHVTSMELMVQHDGRRDAIWAAVRDALGVAAVGDQFEGHGLQGVVERSNVSPGPTELLIRLGEPIPGLLNVFAYGSDDGPCTVGLRGYLFSDEAVAYIEREQPAWTTWFQDLAVPVR
jgi:uncharacterized protein YndB with AHSA1/START domain